jgi:hypothetical protein
VSRDVLVAHVARVQWADEAVLERRAMPAVLEKRAASLLAAPVVAALQVARRLPAQA